MTRDIVIAGVMILASVAALLGIVVSVARAVREKPEAALAHVRVPAQRRQGW